MLVSIPLKAKDEYIRLCHDVLNSKNELEFNHKRIVAATYGHAIKAICPEAWLDIYTEADLSFPEGTGLMCGIPVESEFRKPQTATA